MPSTERRFPIHVLRVISKVDQRERGEPRRPAGDERAIGLVTLEEARLYNRGD